MKIQATFNNIVRNESRGLQKKRSNFCMPSFGSADTFEKHKKTSETPSNRYTRYPEIVFEKLLSQLGIDENEKEITIPMITKRIRELVRDDALTGLRNKKALYDDLKEYIDVCKETNIPMTVSVFDMDNFKSTNELLDYEIGDEFIKEIGKGLFEIEEEFGCKAYRFGGDEFIILMPDKTIEEAAEIMLKAKDKVKNNENMKKYLELYTANGTKIIEKLKEEQKPLDELKTSMRRLVYLNEIIESAKKTNDVENILSFLEKEKASLIKIIETKVDTFVEIIKNDNISERNKDRYLNALKNFKAEKNALAFEDISLDRYMNTRFNHTAKISQIELWLSHVQRLVDGKPHGFTYTVGINRFENFDNLTPNDIIQQTGKLSSEGKNIRKGKIYTPEGYPNY